LAPIPGNSSGFTTQTTTTTDMVKLIQIRVLLAVLLSHPLLFANLQHLQWISPTVE
jgi:hypothetical protein